MSYNSGHQKPRHLRQPFMHGGGRPYPPMPYAGAGKPRNHGYSGHVTTPAAREEEFVLPNFRGNEIPNGNGNPNLGTPHHSSPLYDDDVTNSTMSNNNNNNNNNTSNSNSNEVACELPASFNKTPMIPRLPAASPAANKFKAFPRKAPVQPPHPHPHPQTYPATQRMQPPPPPSPY